jgi:hypothetical protein
MTTTSFQYRSYAVGEIAVLYFPSISPGSATRNLSRYINLDEDLLARLRAHGYRKGIRILTPAMVADIVECMGKPSDFLSSTT